MPKVLSPENGKKNEFSLCILLTYPYLCIQICKILIKQLAR